MVHGPRTKKVLPSDESPCLTLLLNPITVDPHCTDDRPPLKPPRKPPRRLYYITVACTECDKRLGFCAKTSKDSILSFEKLLLADLDILCSACENKHG
ncbi:putative transforming protein E7 [Rangifer tarandus papillomavirus 1]|uniref:Protein E7 n=1 Tax=Rangifer tarandus papillomavirus 1 TaxID=2773313 RepID=Q8BDR4_9PAPI|nr:putative transforming protein E7 [Rangifer tarandus papillomavirus 1]